MAWEKVERDAAGSGVSPPQNRSRDTPVNCFVFVFMGAHATPAEREEINTPPLSH
jgi:hypothetical protein